MDAMGNAQLSKERQILHGARMCEAHPCTTSVMNFHDSLQGSGP
jgi:hypothetical protein